MDTSNKALRERAVFDAAMHEHGFLNGHASYEHCWEMWQAARVDALATQPQAAMPEGVQYMLNLAPDVILALRNTDRQPLADLMTAGVAMLRAAPPSPTAQAAMPEGWKLVPVVPTPEMIEEIRLNPAFSDRAMHVRYAALLAAAPPSPQPVAESVSANDRTTAYQQGYQAGIEMGKALAADEATPAAALQPGVRKALEALVGEYGKQMTSMRIDSPRRKFWRDAVEALAVTAPAIEPVAGLTDAWLPIETAPEVKGECLFCEIAWGPEGDQSVGNGMRWQGRWFAAGTFHALGQERRYEFREIEVKPTHWRRGPDAPALTGNAGDQKGESKPDAEDSSRADEDWFFSPND